MRPRRHIHECGIQRFGTNIVKKDIYAIRTRRCNRFEWHVGLVIDRIVKTQRTQIGAFFGATGNTYNL